MGRLRYAFLTATAAAVLAACSALPAFAYEQRVEYVAWGHGYNSADYLVVHETANPGASAYNHVLHWGREPAYAVHFVMELDGSVVYNTVPDDRLCWHVGNANRRTVGIELAHAVSQAQFDAQWREAVAWCGDYLASRGWGVDRLLSHDECRRMWGGTDHTDPIGYFAQYGRTWQQFEVAVADYLATGAVAGGGAAASADPADQAAGAARVLVSADPTPAWRMRSTSDADRGWAMRPTVCAGDAAMSSTWMIGMPLPTGMSGAVTRLGAATSAMWRSAALPGKSRRTTIW